MATTALRLDAVESADIRGRKTRIRPMGRDEAPLFYEWASDPEVQPFWGEGGHYDSLDCFLSHWQPYNFDGSQLHLGRCFTIEAGHPIGVVAYNRVELLHRMTAIDILIGHPDYRDRGYGTDALRAFSPSCSIRSACTASGSPPSITTPALATSMRRSASSARASCASRTGWMGAGWTASCMAYWSASSAAPLARVKAYNANWSHFVPVIVRGRRIYLG